MNMRELDWGQRYRPSTIQDVILSSGLKNKLNQVVNQRGGISLLFYGRPGCGKTTVAKLINPENTVFINCSTNNSIDTIRWIESEFASGMVTGGRRLLLLDEADNLSLDAQAAIRGVSEELSLYNDFVLTANDPNCLSEAVRSRFIPISFDMTYSEEMTQVIAERLCFICEAEGYTNPDKSLINSVIQKTFPDLRRMVKTLQLELMN
jgi:replication-associated recombination protein RarA